MNQINKKEFIDILSEEFSLTNAEAKRLLDGVLTKISQALLSGQRVYFRSFGYFDRILRPPKKFRNIHTGKIETLPAYYDISFKPSSSFYKKLNKIPVPVVSKLKKSTEAFTPQSVQPQVESKAVKPKRKITLRKLIKLFR